MIELAAWQLYIIIAAAFSISTRLTLIARVNEELSVEGYEKISGISHMIVFFALFPIVLWSVTFNYDIYKDTIKQRKIDEYK